MDLHLAGKNAVVTGASKGIGLEIARLLVAEGVRVVAASRAITGELTELGVAAVPVDLATPEGGERLVERAMAELGGIDILVNNAGGVDGRTQTGGFTTIDDAAWQSALDLNLLSAVRVTRAAIPSLVERRGSIVNISSIGARFAHPPVDYGAAKAALTNLSKALSEELGPRGVRVNTVSPGPTLTRNWKDPEGFAGDLAKAAGLSYDVFMEGLPASMGISTGRLAAPEELAALVGFLVSSHAANITGVDYRVDGGVIKTV